MSKQGKYAICGQRIRKARTEQHMTRGELAHRVGISVTTCRKRAERAEKYLLKNCQNSCHLLQPSVHIYYERRNENVR